MEDLLFLPEVIAAEAEFVASGIPDETANAVIVPVRQAFHMKGAVKAPCVAALFQLCGLSADGEDAAFFCHHRAAPDFARLSKAEARLASDSSSKITALLEKYERDKNAPEFVASLKNNVEELVKVCKEMGLHEIFDEEVNEYVNY